MNTEWSGRLKRFERRVRILRAWRGLAIGGCIGGIAATAWAILDWTRVALAEWSWLGLVVLAGATLGALVGLFMRVPAEGLVDSIDRRAGLSDRLSTWRERQAAADGSFDAPLKTDAEKHFSQLEPRRLFPVRVGRWQAGAVALSAVAASVFLLGNTPILLSDQAKKDREDLKKIGQEVERIVKPLEEKKEQDKMSEDEKRLADQLRRFQRELEKGKIDKQEALEKANEIQKKADELTKQDAQKSEQALAKAETAMDKMKAEALKQAGLPEADPQMAKMSESELKSMEQQLQSQKESLQSQMSKLDQAMKNPNLSKEQKDALQSQKNEAGKKMDAANKKLQQIQLSKEAQEIFKKMMESKEWKELQELAKQLQKNAQAGKQNGSQNPQEQLSKEQLEEMKAKLEALAKELKDPQKMKEYMDALKEALKHANGQCKNCSLGVGINGMFSLGTASSRGNGNGAPSQDIWQGDTGQINKLDAPVAGGGKTNISQIHGERRNEPAPETYVEVRGPTNVGNRTSVPYSNVLPSYKKKAEQAINRQKIPKEHQKRVKQYFDSLTGSK